MRTIQEVGTEIFNKTPAKLYIFGGTEYGIKIKYLNMLKTYYEDNMIEGTSVKEVIGLMSTKHLVPLKPALYVVRYDEEFVSTLNESVAMKLKSLKIIGTLVCLYEADKHIAKLDKFLSNYLVRIDDVSVQFKIKYLHADYPHLPDRLIKLAAEYGNNYGDARNICACMQSIEPEKLFALSDIEMMKLFGKYDVVSEDLIKVGIASRNFSYLIKLAEQYDNLESLYYTILSTMLELEKVLTNKYAQSSLKEYAKRWELKDIYNMFMHTYKALQDSRSTNSTADTESLLIYLFSLLKFQSIPDIDEMED